MQRLVCLLGLVVTPWNASADDLPNIRGTLTKAARFLQDDMRAWRSNHQCAACHHGPFALGALSELSRHEIAVDPGYLAQLTEWTRTDSQAGLLPPPPAAGTAEMPSASSLCRAVYLSWGLNVLGDRTPEVQEMRQRLVQHLQAAQADNGSWMGPVGRPPILNPTIEFTLLTATAWQSRRDGFPELPAMLDKAANWIQTQPVGDSHQELTLRLMWAAGRDDTMTTNSFSQRLLGLQQPDGGWRQAADMASDAFATGQSLVALRRAGIAASDPAVQRAVHFLCRTQTADGAWPMTSRPHPGNGSRATDLVPITYPAAAWAVLGLLTVK